MGNWVSSSFVGFFMATASASPGEWPMRPKRLLLPQSFFLGREQTAYSSPSKNTSNSGFCRWISWMRCMMSLRVMDSSFGSMRRWMRFSVSFPTDPKAPVFYSGREILWSVLIRFLHVAASRLDRAASGVTGSSADTEVDTIIYPVLSSMTNERDSFPRSVERESSRCESGEPEVRVGTSSRPHMPCVRWRGERSQGVRRLRDEADGGPEGGRRQQPVRVAQGGLRGRRAQLLDGGPRASGRQGGRARGLAAQVALRGGQRGPGLG